MKHVFKPGDKKLWQKKVLPEDVAAFAGQQVHPVCATFTLAREMEWASRLFVLDIVEEDEEGIGTFLEIAHKTPALPGELLIIEAELEYWQDNELHCRLKVQVNDRLIATGRTGQKVLKKPALENIFKKLKEQKA